MKILVLRFSSIGDIVLTFPVVRAVKDQLEDVEIHYATKKQFRELLQACTSIDHIHLFEKRTTEIWTDLKKENFDFIIDLHNNIRSRSLTSYLKKKSFRFPKLHVKKWLLVALKWDLLPSTHVVDRYFESVQKLGVTNPKKNNKFYISKENEINLEDWGLIENNYLSIALGAQFKTKQFPEKKLTELIDGVSSPIVLLGGESEVQLANNLILQFPKQRIINFTGKLSLIEAADIVKKAGALVTNDTGMMHIASCFETPIHLIWGNTVRKFGMFSYQPQNSNLTQEYEVKLPCRPCSKIGFDKCPKGHHKCMLAIDVSLIIQNVNKQLS